MRASGRLFSTGQWLLLLVLALGGFAQLGYRAVIAEGIDRPLDAVCASWDREASIGVALLVPDSTGLAEARLDDALYRLRRARKNCRAGRLGLAREDYAALRDTHPFPSRALVGASGNEAAP